MILRNYRGTISWNCITRLYYRIVLQTRITESYYRNILRIYSMTTNTSIPQQIDSVRSSRLLHPKVFLTTHRCTNRRPWGSPGTARDAMRPTGRMRTTWGRPEDAPGTPQGYLGICQGSLGASKAPPRKLYHVYVQRITLEMEHFVKS